MKKAHRKTYYDATEHKDTREDLTLAVSICGYPKIAVDCGCGAGADIAYLLQHGFKVHAFDIEEDAIARCQKRFKNSDSLVLHQQGFDTFSYPKSSLVVADASLFFCSSDNFDDVWGKIVHCLDSGGIFSGSFLGPEDSMAQDDFNKDEIWPDVLALDQQQIKKRFINFEIIRFTEYKRSGKSLQGSQHNWHIFSVVAKKYNQKLTPRAAIANLKIPHIGKPEV